MSFWISRSLHSTLLLLVAFNAMPALQGGTDWGSAHNVLLKGKITKNWFVISRSNLATRRHFDDDFFGFTGAAIGYQFNKQWSFRSGYRQAWLRPGKEWLDENRPFSEVYYAKRFNGFRLSSRSRIEFREFDYRDDDVRLRQEITLEAPWKFTPLKLKPYIEEEIFYSTDKDVVEGNWFTFGFAWRPIDGVKLKLGYRHLYQRLGPRWLTRNVIVTGINYYF